MRAAVAKSNGGEFLNCSWLQFRVVGYAIISEDGMVANSQGQMPSTLVIPADQKFLSEQLDRSNILVHARNSHENHPSSGQRKRLIVSRSVESLETCDTYPNAVYWNPAGTSLEVAAWALGVSEGAIAVLGGPGIYRLFLPRYNIFYLSRASNLQIPGGLAIFAGDPGRSPESVLASNGMQRMKHEVLDADYGVNVATWCRRPD